MTGDPITRDEPLNEPQSLPAPDGTARASATAPDRSRERMGADLREHLGRLVHQERLAAEAERSEAEGRRRFLLEPWNERTEWQRELDMRIGRAVADYALEQNALTWNTSCTSCTGCAALLDSSVREHEARERAESKLDALRAGIATAWGHHLAEGIAEEMLSIIGSEEKS